MDIYCSASSSVVKRALFINEIGTNYASHILRRNQAGLSKKMQKWWYLLFKVKCKHLKIRTTIHDSFKRYENSTKDLTHC